MQLILFIGAQATGKSTFFKQHFADTHLRLNLDMLRTRNREEILFHACLQAKQPLVIDNTNPEPADRARYIPHARAAGFEVIGYAFQSRIADCLARNAARPRPVPEVGVRATHSRLVMPSLAEGFDKLFYVRTADGHTFSVEDFQHEV